MNTDRIQRGQLAADLLRQPVLHDACAQLNIDAFNLFVTAADDGAREQARQMVNGGDALLSVLRGWAVDARVAEEAMNHE